MLDQQYVLRGNRVAPMNKTKIAQVAIGFCEAFNLNKRNRKRLDKPFEELAIYGITLDIISDKQWEKMTYDLTIGHYDPSELTIKIPERVYYNACLGERDALFIILHELGHLFLGHKAILHRSTIPALENEDAEWQADTFAEIALAELGFQVDQLSFDFYM